MKITSSGPLTLGSTMQSSEPPRRLHHLDHVAIEEAGTRAVGTKGANLADRSRASSAPRSPSCARPLSARRRSILQIKDHLVRRRGGRLAHHLQRMPGQVAQTGGSRYVRRSPRARRRWSSSLQRSSVARPSELPSPAGGEGPGEGARNANTASSISRRVVASRSPLALARQQRHCRLDQLTQRGQRNPLIYGCSSITPVETVKTRAWLRRALASLPMKLVIVR